MFELICQNTQSFKPTSRSSAKKLCSDRQPLNSHHVHYVKQSCAFINQQIGELEPKPIRNRGIINNPDEIYRKDGITFVCASTNCV
ncbi:MAG: hypothetical protein HWQ43_12960 [Nostoc sp. JL31]|uniref:hypothetical protein n=1 Tax=Nostoc sp. JL31 TaxID=2815395 RepID=UPI0025EC095F|nr:hypothetical protein [Nostoc sp. JL31]MBN3890034.1 hypothetical protein [Nostoc sp. JL31]